MSDATVTEIAKRLAATGRFAGALLVAQGDQVVATGAWGLADRATGAANTTSTRFNVASVGKTFTAVAVAQLVEAGELRWSDPVLGRRDVRLHHLLSHTSGLGDYFAHPNFPARRSGLRTVGDLLELVADAAPTGPPGATFEYCNSGFVLAGALVERVTDRPFAEHVRDAVFGPAGMTQTGYDDLDPLPPGTARAYDHDGTPTDEEHVVRGGPAGGALSTVGDLVRFAGALMDGTLLRRPQDLWRPRVRGWEGAFYGLGFELHRRSGTVGHHGFFPGIIAWLRIDPGLRWAAAVLANTDVGSAGQRVLRTALALRSPDPSS